MSELNVALVSVCFDWIFYIKKRILNLFLSLTFFFTFLPYLEFVFFRNA